MRWRDGMLVVLVVVIVEVLVLVLGFIILGLCGVVGVVVRVRGMKVETATVVVLGAERDLCGSFA